jgi:integrase/recombinase XerD
MTADDRPFTPAPAQAIMPVPDLTELEQITAAVTALPTLPIGDAGRYGPRPLTAAWLASMDSRHTRRAYFADLADLLAWCDRHGLDPLTVRRADLDAYKSALVGRFADRTIARRLAAVSSWYAYLLENQRAEDSGPSPAGNPVASVRRPKVARLHSPTVGLTAPEVAAVLEQSDLACQQRHAVYDQHPTPGRRVRYLAAARDRALMRTLAGLGLRVGEAISLDVSDQSYNRGHRTIRYIGKGSIRRERVLPAHALEAIDEYLAIRATLTGVGVDALTGPLFATTSATGDPGRLDEPAIFRHIRRLARQAGLSVADRLSPHSLRHAFATTAREEGVPLEDVQDSMDHADPRTTRGYDRDRHNLDRDAALTVSASYARQQRRSEEAPDPYGDAKTSE